ncbi:hypothetical protein HHI36_022047 [Cryptolaemus montrouzieri]|uniref:Uncharacterized protein n=1 Tax=Cryptolaemus montrouzieri TaxID=559131 RepID=A0ABD2MZI1_9CUCU
MDKIQTVAEQLFGKSIQEKFHYYRSSRDFLRRLKTAPLMMNAKREPSVLFDQRAGEYAILDMDKAVLKVRKMALRTLDDITRQKIELLEDEEAFQLLFKQFNAQIVENRQKRKEFL